METDCFLYEVDHRRLFVALQRTLQPCFHFVFNLNKHWNKIKILLINTTFWRTSKQLCGQLMTKTGKNTRKWFGLSRSHLRRSEESTIVATSSSFYQQPIVKSWVEISSEAYKEAMLCAAELLWREHGIQRNEFQSNEIDILWEKNKTLKDAHDIARLLYGNVRFPSCDVTNKFPNTENKSLNCCLPMSLYRWEFQRRPRQKILRTWTPGTEKKRNKPTTTRMTVIHNRIGFDKHIIEELSFPQVCTSTL